MYQERSSIMAGYIREVYFETQKKIKEIKKRAKKEAKKETEEAILANQANTVQILRKLGINNKEILHFMEITDERLKILEYIIKN
jgi:tRNA(Ser,Leu) C12 N-acetylase TAN1